MPRTFYGPFSAKDDNFAAAPASNANIGRFELGHRLVLPDERSYRFTLNDGTVEVAGNLYQSVVPVANHTDQAADVVRAIGATTLSATLGATEAAIDIYTEGMVHVDAAPGEGYAYRIKRAFSSGDAHVAAASSAVLTVNLEPDEELQVALTTSSDLTFTRNRFHQVLITAAPPTAGLAGVSPGVAAVNRFYWSQISGEAAVLANLTLLAGLPVQADVATAGAVESRKFRMTTGGTTASMVTTAVTLRLTDSNGSTVSFFAPGVSSSGASTVDITSGIADNSPIVGMCLKANDSTEYALIDLTGLGW